MKNWLIILVFIAALVALASFLVWNRGRSRFDWRESWTRNAYSEKNDQPYGTEVLFRLLKGYFPGKKLKIVDKSLPKQLPASTRNSNYIFVGTAMYLDSTAVQQLLRFVKNGNTALICSKTIPTELMRFVAEEDCIDSSWADYQAFDDTIAHLRVEQPRRVDFDLSFVRRNKTEGYAWSYLPASDCCTEVLGSVNDSLVCFARFPYGKGRFLLHTIPLALSNYQLLRPEGQAYAEALLSWLTEGDIYWDASSKVPEDVARLQNSGDSERPPEEHLLSFVLQQPALAWSWYLLLALALVYLLFRAKRRQRVIPVLPWNENSSYEFISTIANLHYREKNYRNLSRQMMKQFLLQVRDRYGMPVPLEQANGHIRPEPAYMEQLARITELPQEKIQHIFTLYANCIQYEPNEQMAIDLHLAIEGVKI